MSFKKHHLAGAALAALMAVPFLSAPASAQETIDPRDRRVVPQDRRIDTDVLRRRAQMQRDGKDLSDEKIDPEAGQKDEAEFRRHLSVALRYLQENRELAREMFPRRDLRAIAAALEARKLDEYMLKAEQAIARTNRESKYHLQPIVYSVADFGSTLVSAQSVEATKARYIAFARQIYGRKAAVDVRRATRRFTRLSPDFFTVIWDILEPFEPAEPEPAGPVTDTSQMDCTQEVGYSSTRNDGATACLPPGSSTSANQQTFSSDGLLGTRQIPIEPHLTCTKDQRRRGTCVSFAITANLETRASVRRGTKYNFTEQYNYFKSEINTGIGKYSYGLPTQSITKKWADGDWATGRETTWTYNRGLQMDPLEINNILTFNDDVYPNSCGGYSGFCTDYAFQGEPNSNHTVFTRPSPQSSQDNLNAVTATEITWGLFNQSAQNALMNEVVPLVNANIPVIVSFGVTDTYMSGGEGPGYVVWSNSDGNRSGGHANLIVGFVSKNNLPADAPEPEGEGYFIVKNSWGADRGDCGYDYLDEKWLRKKMTSLTTLSVD